MTIEEILALEPKDAIAELKKRVDEVPPTTNYDKEYELVGHKVNDKTIRPDKKVTQSNPTNPSGDSEKTEYVARILLALQKIIVGRAASFLFGDEPVIKLTGEGVKEEQVVNILKRILSANKAQSENRRIARLVMRYTEAAEYWFAVESEPHTRYGIPAKVKIRHQIFSAKTGDTLYPLFDEFGDLIAFSRAYEKLDDKRQTVNYFETWTANVYRRYKQKEGQWVIDGKDSKLPLGKIPIVYVQQEQVEWADVQALIDRLEKLLSNFADTNDYHGAPKIFVQGKITGFASKGESGAIIEGDAQSKAEYLSWDNAPESVKLEIETLLRLIYTLTQTPDISFESVKGLGQVSGIALKLLFLDAHLKVLDKTEVFGDMLQRRLSIILSLIGTMQPSLQTTTDNIIVTAEIKPFILEDLQSTVEILSTATGGKPIVSVKTAVRKAGIADDTEQEVKDLQAEEERASNLFNTEPTQ